MLVRTLLIIMLSTTWAVMSQGQSVTEKVEDITISSTRAQLLGTTPPIRDLIKRDGISKEKKDALKRLKKVPDNFKGRRSTGNAVHPELEHQGPDRLRQKTIPKSNNRMQTDPIVNLDGLSSGFGSPADPTGDVSDRFYVQAINSTDVGVYDLEGNMIDEFAMATLWTALGVNSLGDPIIIFDETEDRWILTEFTGPANLLVGISDTDDPLGSYTAYSFSTPNFPDYPKYSLSPDALVVTTNEQGPGNLHQYFLNKAELMAGAPEVGMIRIEINGNLDTEAGFYVTTPVDLNGANQPFDRRPLTMAINDSSWQFGPAQDQVEIYAFNLDFAVPNNSTVERTSIILAPFDSFPCSALGVGFHCVPQRNGAGLDALPELILNVPHQRNFGTHESLVFNFVTDVTDGDNLAGLRWVELRRTANEDWSLHQEGTFAPADGLDRYMGGIAIDNAGTIALAYNVSSEDEFVGMRYTGRFDTDPLGVMTIPEVTVVDGTTSINSGGRFGDYTQMSVSPFGENQFWFTGEYAGFGGRTRIVSFAFQVDTFDLAAQAVTQPVSSHLLTNQEVVVAEFVNAGLFPITNFTVSLALNGVTVATDNVALTLEPREIYTHQFSQTVDLSVVGDYELTTTISNPSDLNEINDSSTTIVSQLLANDASVGIAGDETGCSLTAPFTLTITNEGNLPLTTATVDVLINGAVVDQVEFNGSLEFMESTAINYQANIPNDGNNTVEFMVVMINGQQDNAGDNSSGVLNYFQSGVGRFITLSILADNFPGETGWFLETLDGDILDSGTLGTTPVAGLFTTDICIIPDSCYVIRITDTAADGICCGFGIGNIEVFDAEGELIFANDGEFGSELSRVFCEASIGCSLNATFNINNDTSGQGNGSVFINAQGAVGPFMYSLDGGANFQGSAVFTGLPAGDYDVVVLAGDGVCSFQEVITVSGSTSSVDLEDRAVVNMFPNPTSGVFDIEIDLPNYNKPLLNVEILDANGKFVYTRQLGNYDGTYIGTFSLFDYPQGVYFLRLANDPTSTFLHRIVKVD